MTTQLCCSILQNNTHIHTRIVSIETDLGLLEKVCGTLELPQFTVE